VQMGWMVNYGDDKLGLKIIYQIKDKTFRYFFECWDSGCQKMLELGGKIEILIIQNLNSTRLIWVIQLQSPSEKLIINY
jgi:hypothetical protein